MKCPICQKEGAKFVNRTKVEYMSGDKKTTKRSKEVPVDDVIKCKYCEEKKYET